MKNKLTAAVLAASLLASAGAAVAAPAAGGMAGNGSKPAGKCNENPAGWCLTHEPQVNAWVKKTTKTVMLVTVLKAKGKNAMDSLNIHAREAGCEFNDEGDEGPIYSLDCPAPNKDGTGTAMMMVYAGDRDGKPNSIVVWDFRCTQKKEEDCLKDWEEIWDIASDQPPEK